MLDLTRPRIVAFHNELASEIPCEPEEVRADLYAMPLSTLLVHYMNWADRIVRPRPRKVLTWSGFAKNERTRMYASKIAVLQKRIEAGEDLKPFLSDRIVKYGYVRPELVEGKRRGIEWGDKDYALNIHEVHARLSTTAIYLNVSGPEELEFARWFWNGARRVAAARPAFQFAIAA